MGEVDPNTDVNSILNEMERKIYSTFRFETTVGIDGGVSSKFERYAVSSNHPIITNQPKPTTSIPRVNDESEILRSNSLLRIRNSSSGSKRKPEVTKAPDYYDEMIRIERIKLEIAEKEHKMK